MTFSHTKLKSIIALVACIAGLLLPQKNCAQGVITYLDNTSQPIAGNSVLEEAIGFQFHTGTNGNGYALNSVQLLFADAIGNPDLSGFKLLLTEVYAGGPGSWVTFFNSTSNPTVAGLYSFTPQTASTLASDTGYCLLVHISESSFDYFRLSYANSTTATASDDWSISGSIVVGQSWIPIFSINATPVPEPSIFALLITALGIVLLGNQSCYRAQFSYLPPHKRPRPPRTDSGALHRSPFFYPV